ncbi:MAG: hypothetical protein IKM51_03545, partial [Oscillospiraceae bacterium]|nr:hypothetical protein [Oscillospiraceae bacterium]
SGDYIDEWGTAYDYTFELPQFAALTPALEKINEEILERFEGAIQDSLRAMENNEFIDCDLTGWEMSLHEGMLMLNVYSSYTFEMEDHAAWYYDISEDRRLDGREAAERLGISEDEFLESVRTVAKECYEAHFSHISEAERDSYGYYEMLEWTVSDEAVNFSLPIVLENGRAAVYARIGSLAGAGEFWALVSHFQ